MEWFIKLVLETDLGCEDLHRHQLKNE